MAVQLKRTVRELFAPKGVAVLYSPEARLKPFFPSTSSNYNNSRALGGCVGHILRDSNLLEGLKGPRNITITRVDSVKKSQRVGYIGANVVNTGKLLEKFSCLITRIADAAMDEEPVAVPLGLPEPLKVRVITKGPPLTYTVMKPLQKFIWKTMSRHPCFRLTGQPVDATFIQSRLGKKLPEGKKFLSADYSDATNEIRSWCTEIVFNEIADILGLSDNERVLGLRSLTQHMIENPETGERKKQLSGQLMGSILSFPILCLINATVCRWALELDDARAKKGLSLKDCRLMINGDDALMVLSEHGRSLWKKISAYAGLKESIGKVFYSSDFMNINSMNYVYHREPYRMDCLSLRPAIKNGKGVMFPCLRQPKDAEALTSFRPAHYEEGTYVNYGLLNGVDKSGTFANTDENSMSLGGKVRDLMKYCPSALKEHTMAKFIHKNKVMLQKMRLPWFIPERFGGLGFPPTGRFQPSSLELRVANKIYMNLKKFPLPRIEVDPTAWPTWQLACEMYPASLELDAAAIPSMGYEWNVASDLVTSLDYVRTENSWYDQDATVDDIDSEDLIDNISHGTLSLAQIRSLACIDLLFNEEKPLEKYLKLDSGKPLQKRKQTKVRAKSKVVCPVLTKTVIAPYYKLTRYNQAVLKDKSVLLPEPLSKIEMPELTKNESKCFILNNVEDPDQIEGLSRCNVTEIDEESVYVWSNYPLWAAAASPPRA